MRRGPWYFLRQLLLGWAAAHQVEGFGDGRRATVGQAGDDRAAGEDVRIGRQHHRRHCAAGGQAGYKNARGIQGLGADKLIDHLSDRKRLAHVTLEVAGHQPIEAEKRIVLSLLLGKQLCEPISIGKLGPARTMIIGRSCLSAAMQDNDQRRTRPQPLRDIRHGPKRTGVRTKTGQIGEAV